MAAPNEATINAVNYNAIEYGMTHHQVTEIDGGPGEQLCPPKWARLSATSIRGMAKLRRRQQSSNSKMAK